MHVCLYVSPGLTTVDGNCEWFGESGNFCVSIASPPHFNIGKLFFPLTEPIEMTTGIKLYTWLIGKNF
jgi:hypothetical protein